MQKSRRLQDSATLTTAY